MALDKFIALTYYDMNIDCKMKWLKNNDTISIFICSLQA